MEHKSDLSLPSYKITKESNSNFFYSFFFLSPEKRKALYSIYSLCRSLDDAADKSSGKPEASEALLKWTNEITNMYQGKPSHPITIDLKPYIDKYSIPQKYFSELVKGVEMDLTKNRYNTFDELHKYCYRVAAAVGLICVEVFGYKNATTLGYAVDLGIAMQLTNILRDIKADAANGRIYLPLEDMKKFGYTEEDLFSSTYNQAFVEIMRFESERAHSYYKRAEETLPKEDRRTMVAAEIMKAIYIRLLQQIESLHYDVFTNTVKLSKLTKITIALKTWGQNRLGS